MPSEKPNDEFFTKYDISAIISGIQFTLIHQPPPITKIRELCERDLVSLNSFIRYCVKNQGRSQHIISMVSDIFNMVQYIS